MGKKWEKAPYNQVAFKPGVEVTVEPVEGAESLVSSTEVVTPSKGRGWHDCEECGCKIWRDLDGEFYHRLSCSKSNGIAYGEDHTEEMVGKTNCQCVRCEKVKK